jgi:hypothetical protein
MDENILAGLALDESKSFGGIEPFYGSLFSHRFTSFVVFKLFVLLDRLQEIKAARLNLPLGSNLKVHKSDKRGAIVTCLVRRHCKHDECDQSCDVSNSWLTLPAQPVDATPSSALIKQRFRETTICLAVLCKNLARAVFLLV